MGQFLGGRSGTALHHFHVADAAGNIEIFVGAFFGDDGIATKPEAIILGIYGQRIAEHFGIAQLLAIRPFSSVEHPIFTGIIEPNATSGNARFVFFV